MSKVRVKWGLKMELKGYPKYDDYLPLHWHVYAEHHGKRPRGYDIHHIDWNKDNNDPDNLIALPRAVHVRAHAEGTKKRPIGRETLEQWKKEYIGECVPDITFQMERMLQEFPKMNPGQLRYLIMEAEACLEEKSQWTPPADAAKKMKQKRKQRKAKEKKKADLYAKRRRRATKKAKKKADNERLFGTYTYKR